MPRARREPCDSPVSQRLADPCTDLVPVLAQALTGQHATCADFELFRPRPLDCCYIVHDRTLKADQQLDDQIGTLLAREREGLTEQ